MSLPEESVAVNTLPEVTTIPTGKKLIFTDPDTNEGGSITLENLTKQILQNLTSQTFTLDQGNLTLLQALNQLNSKALPDIYQNYLWKVSHSIDVSKANTLLMILFCGTNGNQNLILPMTKTGADTWTYRLESLASTKFTISCKNNIMTITNTQTSLCFLIKIN